MSKWTKKSVVAKSEAGKRFDPPVRNNKLTTRSTSNTQMFKGLLLPFNHNLTQPPKFRS